MIFTEPHGWKLVILGDNYRRGLWERKKEDGTLELCAGREGGEAFFSLEPNKGLSIAEVNALEELLDVVRFSADESNSPETGRERRGDDPPSVPPEDHPLDPRSAR